jgi:hypothetical protein
MAEKALWAAISLISCVAGAAPIDRTRMRVAEEAMREKEKALGATHIIRYAPAPCPRVVRDVLKKFSELHTEACPNIEIIPCTEGKITLHTQKSPRWQAPAYQATTERITTDLSALLSTEKIESLPAQSLESLADLSEGRYADILQICIPKERQEELVESDAVVIREEALAPGSGIQIVRYSALHPSHEQVYSKEFAALIARILGSQEKKRAAAELHS